MIFTFAFYVEYQRISGASGASALNSISYNSVSNTISGVASSTSVPIQSVPIVATPVKKISSTSLYKDGRYTGISADAYYGNIQIVATISSGKLTDVQFLDYPHDRGTSIRINTQAMPYLRSEAIQAQSANVNTVSGATDSSGAFRQSLASALTQAKNL